MPISVGARAVLAGTLLLLPAAARADSRAQQYYYEDVVSPFFALDPARPGWYKARRPGAIPSEFPAVKSTDTLRVFVIGGSIAGLLHSKDGPGEFAESLRSVLPSRKVEVLNCGMAGYDSWREALVEQEILDYAPDLVVLLTGHNEGLASAPMPVWIMHAQERLARFASFRALVKTLHPQEGPTPARTDALSDARDAAFSKNLGESVRRARERGVAVAVVVPPRNYREPVESERQFYDPDFVPGWIRFLKGDYAGAREFWTAALDAPVKDAGSARRAYILGFIARAEEKLGLWKEARASFDAAARFDRAAICGARCQDILRETTKKEGGFLVEADRMFRGLAEPRMPGLETFNDRMHWKPKFNCLMSSEIVAALRAQPATGAWPWDEARVKALAGACVKPGVAASEEDDRRILGYVLMGLSWPNFSRLSSVSVFYLQALRHSRPQWFKDPAATVRLPVNPTTQSYGMTIAAAGVVLPRFYWHLAEARMLDKDYAGAVADLTKALELDPTLAWARVSLGIARTLGGDKARGQDAFKDAILRAKGDPARDAVAAAAVAAGVALGLPQEELAASDPDYWLERAGAAIKAGRGADGLAALEKARALSPQPHQQRLIGQYERMLSRGVEPGPAAAKAANELDGLLAKAGASAAAGLVRRTEGLAALDRARTLSPEPHQVRLIAQYYRQFGEMKRFLELSDDLVKLYPSDPDLWVTRAEAALSLGRKDAALDALAHAESLSPGPAQKKLIDGLREGAKK